MAGKKKNSKKEFAENTGEQPEDIGTDYELDKIDYSILELKVKFPNISAEKIAKQIGCVRQTVQRRTSKPAFKAAYADYMAVPLEMVSKLRMRAFRELGRLLSNAKSEHIRIRAIEILLLNKIEFIENPDPGGNGDSNTTGQFAEFFKAMVRATYKGDESSRTDKDAQ